MRTHIELGLQVLRRTAAFLEEEIKSPSTMGPIGKHVEALKGVTERLAKHAAEQDASDRAYRRVANDANESARAIARRFVRPLWLAGKVLFPLDENFRTALKMRNGGALSYEAVIASAEGIASQAEARKAEFVDAGFDEGFVERLRGAIVDLRNRLDDKAKHYGRRSEATAGMLKEYRRGRDLVRMLDAMVAPMFVGQEVLARWKTLSRFTRVKGGAEAGLEKAPVVSSSTPVPVTPAGNGTTFTADDHAA